MNNYHIYEQQAKGKYSVIFKARKKKRLQFVAIKRLQKTRKAKVYNEAQILSQLNNHPNIIKFFDFMQTKNHMWQITEYCPGGDLLKIIEYDKQLPEQTVRSFILQIMAGMQYAHSKGIVICDIKPASILVTEYGSVKIGDFGSAQRLVNLMGKDKSKKKGTPSYMAPQLFQVNGVYSFQSDLWAIGCMMYQLGQGNPPFVSTNFQQIAQLSRTGPTPKIDSFSSQFNSLLCSLLQKDPANRIQWKKIIRHPWIKQQLPQIQMPEQSHFVQYLKSRSKQSKVQNLRVSHNFQNQAYGNDNKLTASDRREVFEFDNYHLREQGDDEQNDNQYYEQQQIMQSQQNRSSNNSNTLMMLPGIQVNMKKNKKIQTIEKTQVIKNKNKSNNTNDININYNKTTKQNKHNQPSSTTNPKILQDSTTINNFLQTLTSKPSITLQQAISHQSDAAVKPIIGNKDIELIQSINFNKNQLGFSYVQPELLAEGIVNHQVDDLVKRILQGMKGEEKMNVLGYFQTIVQNSQVANQLFKSNYIPYYMSLLKNYKHSSLRAKVCEVLGLLIRHATSIEPDILKYGIITGFVQTVTKDKSQKVRRKAMAALGQLLFYGATQVDEDALQWDISLSLINTLMKILKNTNEDEIVRIYCCKTIENITAQAQRVGMNFAQMDNILIMLSCFNSTKNQGFRTSIMCTIHHMIVLNQSLRELFLEKMPQGMLIQTLSDNEVSTKTVQILLWVILQQLMKSPKGKITKSLMQNKQLLKVTFFLIDSSSSVVKGRVYLIIYYILNSQFKKISIISQTKLFHSIQRHGKQVGKFQSQALQFVVSILYDNFHLLLKLCAEQLQTVMTQHNNMQLLLQKNSFITIISQTQACSIFSQLFNSQQNVQFLVNLMNSIEVKTNKDQPSTTTNTQTPYLQHFKNHYFLILEKIFTNQSTTEKLQQFYSASILPFFIGKLLKTASHQIMYSCIKYIIYLINFCLSEDFLYDSTILTSTSSKISSLILTHLIPQLDILFDQGEVVGNMMFKLMAEVFKNRSPFIIKFWESCNIQKVLMYYGQSSTINVLKSIQQLFSYNCGNTLQTKYLATIEKFWSITIQLLQVYKNSGQQLFLQYPLTILTNILKNYQSLQADQLEVDNIYQLIVCLQGHQDTLVRIKAEQLMEVLLKRKLFSQKGLQDWRNLSKKGMENYEVFTKLSGFKANIKPTQAKQIRNQKQSRYSNHY